MNKRDIIVLLSLAVLNLPAFFDIYRTAAFNIVPHDDYVPYLLYLIGEGGGIPQSPTGYRFFSVAVAIPFYYLLPFISFSYLDLNDITYLKALEALSFVSYLAISVSGFIIYKLIISKYQGKFISGLVGALASLLLFRFTAIYGVDPFAILMICALLYYEEHKWIFTLLLLFSVGVNEKVVFLFFMLYGARTILSKRKRATHFLVSIISCFFLYFLVRFLVDLPGHEYMVQPNKYFDTITKMLSILFTFKSFYLNWIPGVMMFGLYGLALRGQKKIANDIGSFTSFDFIPIVGFFIIGIVTNMQFTVGRILLFCFPLYLPLAIIYLESIITIRMKNA